MFKSKKVIGAIVALAAAVIGAATGVDIGALVAPATEIISSMAL